MKLQDTTLLRQQAYIDGRWCDADSGQTLAVNDPASGELLGHVPLMGSAEAVRAIEAAEAALADWRGRTAKERASILRRWFELLLEHEQDLARLMTREQGKPCTKPWARSATPPPSSSGSPRKASASTAM